ncbi:BgTH12-01085, partial [Blumeria graminis f. sp. triticale]
SYIVVGEGIAFSVSCSLSAGLLPVTNKLSSSSSNKLTAMRKEKKKLSHFRIFFVHSKRKLLPNF